MLAASMSSSAAALPLLASTDLDVPIIGYGPQCPCQPRVFFLFKFLFFDEGVRYLGQSGTIVAVASNPNCESANRTNIFLRTVWRDPVHCELY